METKFLTINLIKLRNYTSSFWREDPLTSKFMSEHQNQMNSVMVSDQTNLTNLIVSLMKKAQKISS